MAYRQFYFLLDVKNQTHSILSPEILAPEYVLSYCIFVTTLLKKKQQLSNRLKVRN